MEGSRQKEVREREKQVPPQPVSARRAARRRTGWSQLGQHVVRSGVGGPEAVAVGVDGVVPIHVHVHLQGVKRDITGVHGAVGGIHVWGQEGDLSRGLQATPQGWSR